ncbi:MAG: phosphoheptose isomerase [Cytophagales bacterium]|nr:phosphoheptose isomerase [Cytophagales bacterium]
MLPVFESNLTAQEVFANVETYISELGYQVISKDFSRPWGGFFVLDESQAAKFAAQFFSNLSMDAIQITNKLSPKFLIVAPVKRLSWQYHFRRSEIWTVISGPVGIATSDTDAQGSVGSYVAGDFIKLQQGERHRLIGLDHWGVVAEIWQHTDENQPSDESDIVRLQDDFGR